MTRSAVTPPRGTLTIQDAATTRWDIIVIGAGPAGAMAGREACRKGLRVLLVDRAKFPRSKVCGCCVNRAAIALLNASGLSAIPAQGSPLHQYQLASRGRVASIPLQGGIAVSREYLDTALIRSAIQYGAHFLDATQALLQPSTSECQVLLKQVNDRTVARCRLAIVANGLGTRFVADDTEDTRFLSARSRIGAGVVLDDRSADYDPGVVYMACHRFGYVGLVRLENGWLDVAAAFDASAVKSLGGLGKTAVFVLSQAGLPIVDGLIDEPWHGTAKLTQRRVQPFGTNFLVVGDAAGYVEPFTGEGIAWAIATGKAVVPHAIRAIAASAERVGPSWSRAHRRVVGHRMRVCRTISFCLRQPALVGFAVWALARQPRLIAPVERMFNAPFVFDDAGD